MLKVKKNQTESFPANLRLRKKADFDQVIRSGKRWQGRFAIYWLLKQHDAPTPMLGVMVPKKALKKAVSRNQVRRRYVDMFRKRQYALTHVRIVILVRHPVSRLVLNQSWDKLAEEWEKLIEYCADVPSVCS